MVEEQPAFLIHARKYTDSRILVDLLTDNYGKISGVYRQPSRRKSTTALPSFTPLLVSWKGGNALKSLTHIEATASPVGLKGKILFCGFYLNELMQKCLLQDDPHEGIFGLYQATIASFLSIEETNKTALEIALRNFEFSLLGELGFAINFETDCSDEPISGSERVFYRYLAGEGFVPQPSDQSPSKIAYSGATLRAVGQRDFSRIENLNAAKMLCRQAFNTVLGGKEIKARELFR